MNALAEVAAAGVVLGLLSSLHCIGMCGPFALKAAMARGGLAAFAAGKSCTYLILGVLAGALGETLAGFGSGVRAALGVVAGVALIYAGVRMLWATASVGGGRLVAWMAPWLRGLTRSLGASEAFVLGAGAGALPCGVVHLAALQAAATSSALLGAAFMAAFAVGTLPAPVLVAGLGRTSLAKLLHGDTLRRAMAALLLAGGALALWRAVPTLLADGSVPPCCH